MIHLSTNAITLFAQVFMNWISQVPHILDSLSVYSWTFACPPHCSSSTFLPLAAGVVLGLCLGIILGIWIFSFSIRCGLGIGIGAQSHPSPPAHSFAHRPTFPSSSAGSPEPTLRQRSRVSGYLAWVTGLWKLKLGSFLRRWDFWSRKSSDFRWVLCPWRQTFGNWLTRRRHLWIEFPLKLDTGFHLKTGPLLYLSISGFLQPT